MERRNTIQNELVLGAVRSMKRHVSADEVYLHIHAEHPSVGKGTVYRNLSLLAEQGKIRRISVPDGPDRFDFTLTDHYHVQCVMCGQISDVDMEVISDLVMRIRDRHGFVFREPDILFRGICPACQNHHKKEECT